jgi:transcriptional regulator with GAF, ATPase, and Fis domain
MPSPQSGAEGLSASQFSQWYEFNQALASAKDVSSLFSHSMAFLAKSAKVKHGLLGLLDGTRRQLVVEEIYGPSWKRVKGNSCMADEGYCGEVMRRGCSKAIANVQKEPLLQGISEEGQRPGLSCICAPLRWGDIPLGVLLTENPRSSSNDGLTFLEAVAACISPPLVVMRWGKDASLDEILMSKLERAVERMDLHTESHGNLMADVISLVERTLILTALKKSNYVQMSAARFLGINRNTLRKKIKELGINLPES